MTDPRTTSARDQAQARDRDAHLGALVLGWLVALTFTVVMLVAMVTGADLTTVVGLGLAALVTRP